MRKTLLAAAAALALAGTAGGGALLAQAQPAPPPPAAPGAPPPAAAPGGMHDGWMHGWMHWGHHHDGREEGRSRRSQPGTFALFHHPGDRALTPADVQKIADGLLVWNGNHAWKVIDVAAAQDGTIGFAYAAPDNTVIARFSIDTRTGRLTRTG